MTMGMGWGYGVKMRDVIVMMYPTTNISNFQSDPYPFIQIRINYSHQLITILSLSSHMHTYCCSSSTHYRTQEWTDAEASVCNFENISFISRIDTITEGFFLDKDYHWGIVYRSYHITLIHDQLQSASKILKTMSAPPMFSHQLLKSLSPFGIKYFHNEL